jgi:serine/threonine protein phosphatase PrpC
LHGILLCLANGTGGIACSCVMRTIVVPALRNMAPESQPCSYTQPAYTAISLVSTINS